MRWQEKSRADWIINISECLHSFSKERECQLELIGFENGIAKVILEREKYSEDFHYDLQSHVEKSNPGVSIFFPQVQDSL